MNNEVRELVRDYLNGDYTEEEIMNKFDLKKCSECESIELEEDMEYHIIGKKILKCLNRLELDNESKHKTI